MRKSQVFASRQAAKDWAARQEYLILNSEGIASQAPFGDLLDRYAREVTVSKRGARVEILRINRMRRDDIAWLKVADLRPADFAAWRDRRLKDVGPASVIREMQTMSSAINVAIKEWGLLSTNPLTDVRRPAAPPARDRLPTAAEMERLALSAGDDLQHATARAYHAWLFALETAMRAGEICGLTWDRVDLTRRTVHLEITKNGRSRQVPLSSEAARLLEALPKADPVFGLTPRSLDALWRKLRSRAGVEGLTFHDSRHAAITRLAAKLDVLALARMVGHRDLKMLQVYYNESAEDLAKRLG
ncbi:tyrosine-type recombinase/integrase [Paroceanicella profunda]|uniref:tyrosine-type recombinase/integrase n=1 Tax=Paroceanicella profunda TaxID=2579971 RepID=UPI001EEF7AD8|nr:site-specific integrase [Paroceanicella profunda]